MREAFIATNGIKLHVVQAGAEDAPLLICLHGFPEYWRSWYAYMEPLVEAGYQVWLPDMRGYNLSDKPQDVAAYNIDLLTQDILGLAETAGVERFVLVGHDWGGAVGWWMATKYAERLHKLVIANVPHHKVLGQFLSEDAEQRERMAYMFTFQQVEEAEQMLRRDNYALLTNMLVSSAQPETFSEDDIKGYIAAWSQPGALTGMLNYYRAALQERGIPPVSQKITTPLLLFWGKEDSAMKWEMAQASMSHVENGHLALVEDATHWIQHERRDLLLPQILDFVGAP